MKITLNDYKKLLELSIRYNKYIFKLLTYIENLKSKNSKLINENKLLKEELNNLKSSKQNKDSVYDSYKFETYA